VSKDLGADGEVGVLAFEMERLIHVVRRFIEVGVWGAGGVMGLEHRAMVLLRDGGSRVRRVEGRRARGMRNELGVAGDVLPWSIGAEKAEPMSERVSERTCIRMLGAMYGTW